MPTFSASQLIGKTFTTKKPLDFYKAIDVTINSGYKAKPVSNKLPKGYKFKMNSFLVKGPTYLDNYGILHPELKDDYFLFYGQDKNYYAVKNLPGSFDVAGLTQQGVLNVEQQAEAEEEKNKTPLEKATDAIANIFGSTGKIVRNVIYIGVGVWAIGYLIPKIKK